MTGLPNRIVVLTRQPDAHGITRLVEAAGKLGVNLHTIDPHELYLRLARAGDRTGTAQAQVEHATLGSDWRTTVILPRLASLATEYSLNALEALERAGARSINGCRGLLRLRHKFTALNELASAGLPVPDTIMLHSPSEIAPAVKQLGGYPMVLKFVRGSQGVGVIFAPDAATVTSVVEAMNLVQYDVMLQRFYPQARERDQRILVINGEPRWAVIRQAAPGAFRANFHRGGSAKAVELEATATDLARRAAACFELGLAGVDLIESEHGWLVLEVNGSPGYATIEQAHGVDVAAEIITVAMNL